MIFSASAPSNIALIKYMGKQNADKNTPSNPSLSYTLNHLQSFVELELSQEKEDQWQPLQNHLDFQLSEKEKKRFLSHLLFIKKYFDYRGNFLLRSANNFPASCGLASSASSFAALTKCAVKTICALQNKPLLSDEAMSMLSRQGSGSSCRSFFEPFALWDGEQAQKITFPYSHLLHMTILITRDEKKVSSSNAHKRVQTSLLFSDRPERARLRLKELINVFENQKWEHAYQLIWQEFWDMHALFETSRPPFGYLQPNTLTALLHLRHFWNEYQDGPLVTMDAGPNIHLLFRPNQQETYCHLANELGKTFTLFTPHLK